MKNLLQYFFMLGLMAITGFGCQSLYKSQFKQDTANLFYEDAIERSELIKDVNYYLEFEIGTEKTYKAKVNLEFSFKKQKDDIFLDFQKANIDQITVNDHSVDVKKAYSGFKIFLNKDLFKNKNNKIEIHFNREYVKDGDGLHQSKDPSDGRVYLYSNLEPYSASRVFPSFDQPDLKAKFKMQVTAPKSWQVITSVREDKVEDQKDKKVWSFPESPIMSTYLWSLHAGPYAVIEGPKKPYPLRLFVRQSLKKYVNKQEWFPITQYGFKYFEDLFGVKYAFKKYDQIIVPEFNPGAMENIAAVTFNEVFVSRGKKTILQKYSLAETLLHEQAHMWFGNLVTMKWWDDLWLNESFATFVSNLALSEHPDFKSYSWPEFYNMKLWAYSEDLMPTTHAIYTEVVSTNSAFTQFDGITYGKGAAWLKQLYFRVGKQQFSQALELYFNRHKYKNTVLNDFIQAFAEVNGDENKKWSESWLKTKGVNKLNFVCKNGSYKLEQTAASGDELKRDHIGVLKTQESSYAWKSQKEELIWLKDEPKKCSAWSYPNFNDLGYFIVEYTNEELKKIESNWKEFQDPFLRKMLINDLWHSGLYGKLSLKSYLNFLQMVLNNENDINVLSTALSNYKLSIATAVLKQVSEEDYLQVFNNLEELLYKRLKGAKAGSDLQKNFFKAYLNHAISKKSQSRIKNWLLGKSIPKGLTYDLDLKWSSVFALAKNKQDYQAYLKQLQKIDKSLSANNYQQQIEAVSASLDKKREIFLQIFNDANLNLYSIRYKTYGLKQSISHSEYDQKVAYDFLDQILKANTSREQEVLGRIIQLGPITCDLKTANNIKTFLSKHESDLKKVLIKSLKKMAKSTEICINLIDNY